MNNHPFRRKPNRLPLHVYSEVSTAFLTIDAEGRQQAFRDGGLAESILGDLERAAVKHCMEVLAFCLMPDHLHLLVYSPGRGSFSDFVRDFKQPSGFAFKQRARRRLWQKGYHDHLLRRDEDVAGVASYIWHNPVRAGLAPVPREYPFSGSLVWGRGVLEG